MALSAFGYHRLYNSLLISLRCYVSHPSTFPSSNFYSLRHIAHHIHLVPVYLQFQAMADTKGKGKEVEREETVVEGKLNSLPFLVVMQESPQGTSCSFVASRRRYFVQVSFLLEDFSLVFF
jgi:hypothetical protein